MGAMADHGEGQLTNNDRMNIKDGELSEVSPDVMTAVKEGNRGGIHPRRSSWGRESRSWDMSPEVLALAARVGEPNRGLADMFKNQLQELAQRSCFNLPSYTCIREGPDHAPRFKASVNFNGEIFESPSYCTTLRQAEHAAAEVAFNVLSSRGPSRSLTARVLDETGIYKNLLQETAHRAGLNLPVYTTVRSGPGHVPTFTCTVELAGMKFTGESAKTKKQAEKNAAIAAWSALKRMPNLEFLANKELESREEQDQAVLARVLSNFRSKDEYKQRKRIMAKQEEECSIEKQRSFVSLLPPPPPRTTSKILPPTSPGDDPALYQSIRGIHQTQVKGKQEVKMQEIPVPVEEHQKDEEEWLGAIKKPIEKDSTGFMYRPFPRSNPGKLGATQQESSHIILKECLGLQLHQHPQEST
ncbi:hypothetical protein GH714_032143 [Hevea brasiliensis]|uniref:DRBM domain-containing protein n=1 Tax=Hevea brasiliensis TaxID=3981 RepID=A0A6A6N9Q3_HEVBR|nr:hypothetical protein GH714_032143 [Hevea brasiliensis]